jgi:hypothetical protein
VIEKGYKSKAKYWGNYRVKDVVKLKDKVECYSKEKGKVLFNPTIVKLEWENPPSEDKHDLWFPYWITIGNKEKYGQFAPMLGERALLELLQNAINQDYFSDSFLKQLNESIAHKLSI